VLTKTIRKPGRKETKKKCLVVFFLASLLPGFLIF
jgi:hypothetical protein